MSVVLTVYSTKAFKKYLLPAVDNIDYRLNLQGDLFGIPEDVAVTLENINGKWKIVIDESLTIINAKDRAAYRGEKLENGNILFMELGSGIRISFIVEETEKSFLVYEKYDLSDVHEITIGKDESNNFCFNSYDLISKEHARMFRKGNGFVIEDKSANGTFVNAKRVVGSRQLGYGDCIDIFGLRIVYFGNFLAVDSLSKDLLVRHPLIKAFTDIPYAKPSGERSKHQKKLFHRSPRNVPVIDTNRIEIDAPPAPKEHTTQPIFMTIGPSMTMALPMLMGCALSIYSTRMNGGSAGAFMYTGLVTAVGSALIGTVWAIVNMRQAKKKNREEELRRFDAYSEYLINCTNNIRAKYEHNTQIMRNSYPDAVTCCSYDENSIALWNRNRHHADFLCYRLGLGALPFQAEIAIPKERFTLINDSLSEKPKLIRESYKMLQDVPICVDMMRNKLIGIVGGKNKKGCYQVLHNLAVQIAACNCYTDVKMAFIYDESREGAQQVWEFAKWFPHVWSEDKNTRFVAGNKNDASEVLYEITKVLRMRAEENAEVRIGKSQLQKPYYVLFLENTQALEGELISKYLFESENNCGITTVIMADSYGELPNECEFIIENTLDFSGMYTVTDSIENRMVIKYDGISAGQVTAFARCLSSIEVNEVETGGEVPGMLTFFDMYGVSRLDELDVLERWRKNRTYDSIKALVGQKAGGAPCYLDVHEKYHGPHGLVAGTTGSGKSETLQTYMLSLALNYSPDDIGFFVIDYKGGGMANLFEGLPHMIGQISNLSGNQVRRAMVSIKSENLRRQRIFNEHGVNNINLYTRLYKNKEAKIPVPHMFIIIDEFAELKREEPDFMRELISVAQVGRSLGVHLILATQKPSGTVDDNIWSNSKFRLCLRVQDRQDSADMLHRPDAAYITQAGRCYLQVGNDELFELFQSAWSGAVYNEEEESSQTDIAKMLAQNGRAALIGSYAKIKQKEKARRSWIALLLACVRQSAQDAGCSITGCLTDSRTAAVLSRKFFEVAQNKKIEYPISEYNERRVQDLIWVYAGILQNDQDLMQGSDEEAASVIRFATEQGRKLPEVKEKTQLDAVVEYLAKIAVENGFVNNLQLWLPVLPQILYLKELNGYLNHSFEQNGGWDSPANIFTLETIVGLYDDPVNQAQNPLTVDLASDGNHAIIGTIVSGKSTFLQTYIYSLIHRYTPDDINLYILDYSSKMLGAFESFAHTGGVMYENDDERVGKFFNMLESILEERKKLFMGGSYSQYVQAHGKAVPAIVIVIDNMAAFRNKTNNQYEELLTLILKEGIGYGIYVVASAAGFGISEIPTRMADNFRSVICLEMNDKFAYSDALRIMHLDVLPEENVKGRGLAKIGDSVLEFQTALCLEADDDFVRGELIKEQAHQINVAWKGKRARQIPEIPENPVWSEYCQLEDVKNMAQEGIRLPAGYDKKTAAVYGINLMHTYCYLISGKVRTGKTSTLRMLMMSAGLLGGELTVIDFAGDLKAAADKVNATYINRAQDLFDFFLALSPDFKERNLLKKKLAAAGSSDEEIYTSMQKFSKRFIFIGNLPDFVQTVHNPGEGIGAMAPFVSTLLEKGAMHNVYWIAGFNQDDANKMTGFGVYNLFTAGRNGMHLGGNVAAQRILTFDHITYMEQGKSMKPGIAMLPTNEEEKTTAVVLPLFRMV